jgi:aspartate dehydrogenase
MDIAILGYGAIGRFLCRRIAEHAPAITVRAIVARSGAPLDEVRALAPHAQLLHSAGDLPALGLPLVVECAGHAALRSFGEPILASGSDLLIASVGVLADRGVEDALRRGADAGRSALRIPAGALGGLDVLGAAKYAGLASVVYTSRKAPAAWKGTAADGMLDLSALQDATAFHRSDARTAAMLFPQNANVAAAVALAGIGLDATEVVLVADPASTGNRHEICASGAFGEIRVSILGRTLPDNPKTSMLAPYSLLRSLVNLRSTVVVS